MVDTTAELHSHRLLLLRKSLLWLVPLPYPEGLGSHLWLNTLIKIQRGTPLACTICTREVPQRLETVLLILQQRREISK